MISIVHGQNGEEDERGNLFRLDRTIGTKRFPPSPFSAVSDDTENVPTPRQGTQRERETIKEKCMVFFVFLLSPLRKSA